jgi:tRNA-dihydrouridine synthase B
MKYKIGNIKLNNRVLLAPMLEPNDIAFRLLCKRAGCGLTYTGMTSPLSKAKLYLDDRPALQLFGNSSKGIKNFIKKYDAKVSLWDFNLGCPSRLSKKFGHGACLDDLDIIREILIIIRENTDKPVTIKIRKSNLAFDIVRVSEEVGVDAICIHARTVAQGYSGDVDYEFALKLKASTKLPVIFSGVSNLDMIEKILKDFDFVMLGRLAIGHPEIFSKDKKKIYFVEYLKLAKKYKLFFRQIKYQAMNFTKGLVNGKELRRELVDVKELADVERIMGKNK